MSVLPFFMTAIKHPSDNCDTFPWKRTQLNAMPSSDTWRKKGYKPKSLRTWIRVVGRMLRLTPWSKSNQWNPEEEKTVCKMTPVLKELQLPQAKKWLLESVTKLWLTDNWVRGLQPAHWISHTHTFFTFWLDKERWQQDGSPHFWLMPQSEPHSASLVTIWRSWQLSEQTGGYRWNTGLQLLCLEQGNVYSNGNTDSPSAQKAKV